jgi:hypothetical protein
MLFSVWVSLAFFLFCCFHTTWYISVYQPGFVLEDTVDQLRSIVLNQMDARMDAPQELQRRLWPVLDRLPRDQMVDADRDSEALSAFQMVHTQDAALDMGTLFSSSTSERKDQYANTFQILRLDTGSLSRLERVPKRLYWRNTSSTTSVPRTGNRSRINFRTTSSWSSHHNRWHMRIWQWQHGLR